MGTPLLDDDLSELMGSWLTVLKGRRKSPATLKVYRINVRNYLTWCEAEGLPVELTKKNVIEHMASIAAGEPNTGKVRLNALKQFAKWLAEEEGMDVDGVLTVKPPKGDGKVVPHLADASVKALMAACNGPEMMDKRDKAMVALCVDTGMRAAELLGIDLEDLTIADCMVTVRRGKGGKGRRSKFSAQTAEHIDRYLRQRKRCGFPLKGPLWLGWRGTRLTYSGLGYAMTKRGNAAGIPGFHLHQLRHTSAVRWLSAGGSETGLMAQSGWADRRMVDRYVASARETLAAEEFDRLGLGVES